MSVAGLNLIAVLVAASVAWFFGGLWYRLLAKPWMDAHGFTSEQVKKHHGERAAMWPLIVSFAADLVIALVLAGVLGPLGVATAKGGMIVGAVLWLGFVVTTLSVNNVFGMRKHMLIAIDSGHWLGVLFIMGAIIGGWPA